MKKLFPCLHPLHSAEHAGLYPREHKWLKTQRHTCDANTEQALLSCDVTTKVVIEIFEPKGAFIVHCSCVVVSCSGRISVSAPTTALRYCKEVNLRCSVLC